MAVLLLTVDAYENRLGETLTGARRTQVEEFLGDASDEVRRIAQGELDDAEAGDVPGTVRMVLFSMVTRAVTNPKGLTSERIADYQAQGMRPVYATDEEEDMIRDALDIPAVRTVELTSHMPQRLLDEATAAPVFDLGDHS